MKKVKVQDAVGLTLCHDITAMRDGFKGAAFKRGHVIEEGDVEKLLDLGKRTVFIWEENAGEVHEEDAARRMAAMAQVEGCHYTEPSEGKVLLMADTRGMFRVDTALLNQVNSIGDLTISTLPDQSIMACLIFLCAAILQFCHKDPVTDHFFILSYNTIIIVHKPHIFPRHRQPGKCIFQLTDQFFLCCL